ncbi:MAG TPA: hypothetical protein VH054_26885 [Polyangiaceae bacterium]|nr:hypothetical protein [Polyangiaceae bacterium]
MKRTLALFVLVLFSYATTAAAQDLAPPPPMTQQQQTQPQPQPTQSSQELAPPPPLSQSGQQPPPPPATTEQKLDDSKKEDSGRGIEFVYVNAQIGGVFDAIGTFNNSLAIQQTNAGGAMFGAEAGVRFVWLTLGARFRYDTLPSAFNIWQLDAVLGFHVPLGRWDPYVSIHGGYSAIGTLDPSNFKASDVAPCSTCTSQDAANGFSSKGANVGFSVGVDYYLAKFFSVGVDAGFEFLFLHRDPLAIPAACSDDPTGSCEAAVKSNPLYQNSGDAAGISVMASAHLALHL